MPILNHTFSRQINGWFCGPASVQVALSVRGVARTQQELASSLGTTTSGTNSSTNITRTMNAYLWPGTYEATFIPGNDATAAQRDEFRRDLKYSIDNNLAVVANVVGTILTNDGHSYTYSGGHYVCLVGYDGNDNVLVADVNVREYWVTIPRMATWIAARGYSSAVVKAAAPPPPPAAVPPVSTSTIFGVDLSDFDSNRGNSPATVAKYRAAGISFVTHKSCEVGTSSVTVHSKIGPMLNAAKDSGMPFLGAYLVVRSTASAERQVAEHIKVLDQYVPWWRTFPGFFHQIDLEIWSYDSVPLSIGDACAELIKQQTKQPVVLYASKGQYGNQGPMFMPRWNARYPSSAAIDYRALYDSIGGNGGPGWTAYGAPSVLPEIWQYSSTAVVAGQGTTDVNAFRGSEDDFRQRLFGQSTSKGSKMFAYKTASSDSVYVSDGVRYRPVPDMATLNALIGSGALARPTGSPVDGTGWVLIIDDSAGSVDKVGGIRDTLTPTTSVNVDVSALAAAIAAKLPADVDLTADQVKAAVKDALREGTK